MMARTVLLGAFLVGSIAVGCGKSAVVPWQAPSARDPRDNPARVRPNHCSAGLPIWSPLTQPEVDALRATDAARQGNPKALLALALLASNDQRDAASYHALQAQLDKFVAEVRPKVEAQADDWHRGYELHRAMHSVFFRSSSGGLTNYELAQSRVSRIFPTSRYNCISSAMLFTVLAREFDMPVRGIEVPTHAFVEVGQPGAKTLEIETTSQTGFDLVHDERFYREAAAVWSRERGLAPVTIEQYRARTILQPYQFMAAGMLNQSGLEQGEAKLRLSETAVYVDPDSAPAQLVRTQLYLNEAIELRDAKAPHTTAQFFDCVAPAIADTAQRRANDLETMQYVAWARWYQADALATIGRGSEAVAIAEAGLDTFNPAFKDGAALHENLLAVLEDQMLVLMNEKQFQPATAVMARRLDVCRSSALCAQNLEAVFTNWAADRQNAGDWHGARQALTSCREQLPQSRTCESNLKDLESRHRF
jgi:hypothetical protein